MKICGWDFYFYVFVFVCCDLRYVLIILCVRMGFTGVEYSSASAGYLILGIDEFWVIFDVLFLSGFSRTARLAGMGPVCMGRESLGLG